MKFQATHKLVSYLLAASALGLVTTSGAVPTATLAFVVLVGVLSWFVEPGTHMGRLLDRAGLVFNVGALSFFALSLFEIVRSFPQPDLTPVLNLVLFLLGYKLFHRRSNRDYLQIYVLSFLLVLAGAWLAQSVLFIVGFSAYVVLSTWTLILFHLRREIEDNYLVKHKNDAHSVQVTAARVLNSRRVVGGAFFGITALVALAVLLGAALVFAVIPRIGLGLLSGGAHRPMSMVGFSDEVTLGHHGLVSMDNDAVVFRARIPRIANITNEDTRANALSSLYWRGTVYDTYQNGSWVRSKRQHEKTRLAHRMQDDLSHVYYLESPQAPVAGPAPLASRPVDLAQFDEQEISVVSLSHPVAFALDQPAAFKMPPTKIGSWLSTMPESRWSGEVALVSRRQFPGRPPSTSSDFMGAQYTAYSRDPIAHPNFRAGRPIADLGPGAMDNYLTVPATLAERVGPLAATITKNKTIPLSKVRAVVDWLQRTHGYTLDLKRDTRITDPLEDFIFNQKAGHCEYFASSAAVMLRLTGVPTRLVNGFLGGEWNEFGQHITIRDNRAHSWIEVYLGAPGWVRIDATPVATVPSRMGRVRQLFDSLELFWSSWVLDYDANRQLQVARSLGQQMGLSARKPGAFPWALPKANVLAVATFVVVASVIGRRWLRRRKRPGSSSRRDRTDGPAIARLYQRALSRLGARGWPRGASETPREFATRMRAVAVPGADVLDRLTRHYEASRYGGQHIDPAAVDQLHRELTRLNPVPRVAEKPHSHFTA